VFHTRSRRKDPPAIFPKAERPDGMTVNWARAINDNGRTVAKSSPRPTPDGETMVIPDYWDGSPYVVEYRDLDSGTMWAVDAETGDPLWSDDHLWGDTPPLYGDRSRSRANRHRFE
jgi:outer membrane protein assembly factor BamB